MRSTKKTSKMYSDTMCTLAHKIIEQVIRFIIFFFHKTKKKDMKITVTFKLKLHLVIGQYIEH